MYTIVFYHVGLRLSTVFCTLMRAGVQSRKPKAAIFVLLTYMQIHLQSSEAAHGSRLRQSVNWNSNAVDSFNGYA